MKTGFWGLMLGSMLILAVPAGAVTVDEVIGLTRAEANDAVIIAKIDADGTVFHLTVAEILELKDAGVSDAVITYMINTGKAYESVPEETAPAETEDDVVYEEEPAVDTGAYQTDLDRDYRGSTSITFGFYYPHWPGYWYGYYYDPFWWPSLSYYWVYWQPYPYHYFYYNPWYYCNSYNWAYYDYYYHGHINRHHGHNHYAGYDDDYHDRFYKDRNIGNRGPDDGNTRVVKPSPDGGTRGVAARTYKPNDPQPTVTREGRSVDTRQPSPERGVRVIRSPREEVRPTPAPTPRQVRERPTVRERPRVTPTPTRSGRVSSKEPPARSNRKVESNPAPSPSKEKASSGSSRSSGEKVDPPSQSRSSSSKGSSVSGRSSSSSSRSSSSARSSSSRSGSSRSSKSGGKSSSGKP